MLYRTHAYTTVLWPPFSGTTRVRWCQKKSSGLYGASEDNRGRDADHPAGRHSIRTNQQPTSIISLPIFMPDALPVATLPIYPGLGQAPNMLACIPSGVVSAISISIAICQSVINFFSVNIYVLLLANFFLIICY